MHELGITMEMIDAISGQLGDTAGPVQVRKVVLEIGKLTAVLPDAVRFCFDLCSKDTVAEGAELEIIEVPARGTCEMCGEEVQSEEPFAVCSCGNAVIAWRSGQELKITRLEVT